MTLTQMTQAKDPSTKKQLVTRSQAHGAMIRELKERRAACEETVRVIELTNSQLNECT